MVDHHLSHHLFEAPRRGLYEDGPSQTRWVALGVIGFCVLAWAALAGLAAIVL